MWINGRFIAGMKKEMCFWIVAELSLWFMSGWSDFSLWPGLTTTHKNKGHEVKERICPMNVPSVQISEKGKLEWISCWSVFYCLFRQFRHEAVLDFPVLETCTTSLYRTKYASCEVIHLFSEPIAASEANSWKTINGKTFQASMYI